MQYKQYYTIRSTSRSIDRNTTIDIITSIVPLYVHTCIIENISTGTSRN